MARLSFETLNFQLIENKLRIYLLRQYYVDISLEELQKIADFKLVDEHTLDFKGQDKEKIEKKFGYLLSKHFEKLKNKLNNNQATYIHKNSGIPLIGNVAFGIVYRNSSIIEIKTNTGCNLNCIYCSISEGINSKKNDFVVEKDYLLEELNKLIDYVEENDKEDTIKSRALQEDNTLIAEGVVPYGEAQRMGKHIPFLRINEVVASFIAPHSNNNNNKRASPIVSSQQNGLEIHIGVQGEPFLYAQMEELIEDLQKIKKVRTISIDTNATLLSKKRIDRLAKNSKLRLNFSLDALDKELAREMAGVKYYNLEHVQEMIIYAAEKMRIIIAPVMVQNINDAEMEKIVLWIKSIEEKNLAKNPSARGNIKLGIQNFLRYKTGKNPAKERPWKKFYQMIEKMEEKHELKLKLDKEDFEIHKTKELEKPFKEGDIVEAIVRCRDRFSETVIASIGEEKYFDSEESILKLRNVSVPKVDFEKYKDRHIKVLITRDKHNVLAGKMI